MLQLSEQDEQNSTMVHMKAELSEAISGRVLQVDFFYIKFHMLSKILVPVLKKCDTFDTEEKPCLAAILWPEVKENKFSNMCKTWGRIRMRIGIVLMPVRILV